MATGGFIRQKIGDGGVGIDIVLGASPIDSPIRVLDANENILWQVNPIGNMQGGVSLTNVRTATTSPVSITSTDSTVFIDATSGNITVNLLTAAQVGGTVSRVIRIIKIDNTANTVTLVPSVGGQTINGLATLVMRGQFADVTLTSDGVSKWVTLPGNFADYTGNWVTTTTTPYNVTLNDRFVLVDATAGVKTVQLPAANAVPSGFAVSIKKTDSGANAVTVARAGADTIEGATTATLAAQFNSVNLRSDGVSEWWKF